MRYEQKKISEIRPNPFIDEFYGAFSLQSINDIQLFENIIENGIKTPILVTNSGLIISGNRRYYCAKKSTKINSLPVIIEDIEDDEVTEYMIVSLQLQRIKTEIQIAKEYQIIGNYYEIKRGKGNEEQNKEGRKKRDELMSQSNYSESSIKRVLKSHKLIKELDEKLNDDSAWKKLEEMSKSK